jgi:RNA polymerase sigma factor (sigma-70 family)
MHMHDNEVVAHIVAGDPDGLAEAYDRYADPLYKYCRAMLSDPGDAAGAVQDTFVVAAARLGGLRDPEQLRAWLYAVAHYECLRIAQTQWATLALGEAHDVTDDSAGVADGIEHGELRALFTDAAEGLNPAEREAVELQLRQGLEPAEVASVLGVSSNLALALLSRARDQLEACLGVLLVSRTGGSDCGQFAAMIADWDGHLTPPLRRRLHRHIEQCAACSARRLSELRPSMLLGLSPGAALVAAAADSFRLSPGPPAELKVHTLALAGGQDPSAVAHRAAVLGRAGAFGRDGFPRLVQAPQAGGPQRAGKGIRSARRRRGAVAAGALLAIIIAWIAFALTGNSGQGRLADVQSPGTGQASAVAAASLGATTAAASQAAPSATKPGPSRTPKPKPTKAASRTPATQDPVPQPAPTTPVPMPAPTTSAPQPKPTQTTPSPRRSPPPSPKPSRTTPPPAATLAVSPPGGQLFISPGAGATFSITAQGGSVSWSVGVSGGPGFVSVWPFSGTLADGQQVTVLVSASHWASGRQLTVSPSGTVFTLVVGHGGQNNISATVLRAFLSGI